MTARWNGTRSWLAASIVSVAVVGAGVFSADADDRQVAAEDGGRIDRHRPEIDERADLDQRSTIVEQRERRPETGGMTGGVDDHIDTTSVRGVADDVGGAIVAVTRDQDVGGAELGGE